jgi:hypothetical protein
MDRKKWAAIDLIGASTRMKVDAVTNERLLDSEGQFEEGIFPPVYFSS